MKLKLLLLPMSISVVLSGCWINNLPPQKTEGSKNLIDSCARARHDSCASEGEGSVGGAKKVEKESAEETSYKEDRKKAEDKITEEQYQKENAKAKAKARKHCSIYLKEIRKRYNIKSSNIVMAAESLWPTGDTINICLIDITYPTVYGVQYGFINLRSNLSNGTYEMKLF